MNDASDRVTLVIGLGNPLMGDDGVGITAVERLRHDWTIPATMRLVDGGTWGMNLLPLIEDAGELLLVDAIDRGEPAGRLIVLESSEVPRALAVKLSPHQVGLSEVLALAELRGTLPEKLVAVGVQPGRVEMSSRLTPEVSAQMEPLVALIVDRLEQWGHVVRRREVFADA
jgi:hydrogenase maturation protease